MNLTRIKRWLRRAGAVLGYEARPGWLLLSGFVLAYVFGLGLATTPSERAATIGMVLQVGGLGTVAWGLSNVRRRLRRPGLVARAVAWGKRVAGLLRKPKMHTVHLEAGVYGVAGMSADLSVAPGPAASPEQRLKILEDELRRFRESTQQELGRIRNDLDRVCADLRKEEQERKTDDRDLRALLEEVTIGGLHLEAVGLGWLLAGVVLGTLPNLSAGILRFLGLPGF